MAAKPPISANQPDVAARLRQLPSVERLAAQMPGPRHLAVPAARSTIDLTREQLRSGVVAEVSERELRERAEAAAAALAAGSLRSVVNATGIVLHTNLGRAPLARQAAAAAAAVAAGYTNLEYELAEGERGSRQDHLEPLLLELTGAEAAIAVNNNAAAVLLALSAIAAGREVVIGRDQLVEIGGSFRIPEILAQSGAVLVEVGTTNRTRIADYRAALTERTGALMRVHQSNFRTVGFTAATSLAELCALGREQGVPVIDDLGSGAASPIGDEPLINESVGAGADLVCFSADKLLGGPQAGIIAGTATAVERCRSHPLLRAVRLDKLQVAALEATLRLRRDAGPEALPAGRMLAAGREELQRRARLMAELIGESAEIADDVARAGGGTLPTLELPGPVCAVSPPGGDPDALAAQLRSGAPPVIARIASGRVLLDPRTMSDLEAEQAAETVVATLG